MGARVLWRMPKNAPAPASPVPVFIKGQLWKVGERCIRIEHVGKRLVEHRGVLLNPNRNASLKRLGSIKDLQTFLKVNDGVLIVN
jgi:hypothetical protein